MEPVKTISNIGIKSDVKGFNILSKHGNKSFRVQNFIFSKLNSPISIFDFRADKIVYANDKFLQFTGLTQEECNRITLGEFYSWIEASDLKMLMHDVRGRMEQLYPTLVHCNSAQLTFTVNFRLKERHGKYTHVLSQSSVIEWSHNLFPAAILNLLTDVTDHKKDQKMILSVSMFNECEQQWNIVHTAEFLRAPEQLSKRETEIMKLMVNGKSLEMISEELHISYHTVRTHCQNILDETGCPSQQKLKEHALKEGWV